MSRLDECCTPEQELARQLSRLISLRSGFALKNEKGFESKLFALLNEYGFSLEDAINILSSQTGDAAPTTVL
ncbi:TPA: hypothetical protein QEM49_000262 [Pseudomonas putida]|jgi:hypothetical protein|uniref:hypothetical protein n=1 Tax=Pseudomonas putida TaxID=303 RepID=UPI002363AC28|nr:hypothetical protein [Pseudomonas putida]MDD2008336.1 hypothetical protein [Pseudomonas putida]HDS1775801.1 hypothetical protein [Pseudomonas putida]